MLELSVFTSHTFDTFSSKEPSPLSMFESFFTLSFVRLDVCALACSKYEAMVGDGAFLTYLEDDIAHGMSAMSAFVSGLSEMSGVTCYVCSICPETQKTQNTRPIFSVGVCMLSSPEYRLRPIQRSKWLQDGVTNQWVQCRRGLDCGLLDILIASEPGRMVSGATIASSGTIVARGIFHMFVLHC